MLFLNFSSNHFQSRDHLTFWGARVREVIVPPVGSIFKWRIKCHGTQSFFLFCHITHFMRFQPYISTFSVYKSCNPLSGLAREEKYDDNISKIGVLTGKFQNIPYFAHQHHYLLHDCSMSVCPHIYNPTYSNSPWLALAQGIWSKVSHGSQVDRLNPGSFDGQTGSVDQSKAGRAVQSNLKLTDKCFTCFWATVKCNLTLTTCIEGVFLFVYLLVGWIICLFVCWLIYMFVDFVDWLNVCWLVSLFICMFASLLVFACMVDMQCVLKGF
jgi:hypothetical protein